MAQISIKGHPTRYKEVIEILEMLGGWNDFDLVGDASDLYYYINNDNKITYTLCNIIEDFKIFTVEEFFEIHPYKIGDVVVFKGDNIADSNRFTINKMFWNGVTIKYDGTGIDSPRNFYLIPASRLLPYKKETETIEETMEIKPNQIENKNAFIDIANAEYNNVNTIELLCSDMFDIEIIHEDKIVLKRKKPQYPKTYEECCKVLGIDSDNFLSIRNLHRDDGDEETIDYESDLLEKFDHLWELTICRDAYWKIAGEQMGLGKPWEPEYPSDPYIFTIENHGNRIIKNAISDRWKNRILIFPTEEMRDMFYENFKEMIEVCKDFL